MAVTKLQLYKRVADLAETNVKEVGYVMDALVEALEEIVGNVDAVTIPGIGRLRCALRESRMARNPATGESFKAPANVRVSLRPAKNLKEAVPPVKKARVIFEKQEAAKATRKRGKSSSKTKSASKTINTKAKSASKKSGAKRGRPVGSGRKSRM